MTTKESLRRAYMQGWRDKPNEDAYDNPNETFESWYEENAKEVAGWIAFQDKYPEDGQPVFLYCTDILRFGCWKSGRLTFGQLGPDDVEEGFTHWMPIPEFPAAPEGER